MLQPAASLRSPSSVVFINFKNFIGCSTFWGRGRGTPLTGIYGFRVDLVCKKVYVLLENSGKGSVFAKKLPWNRNIFVLLQDFCRGSLLCRF